MQETPFTNDEFFSRLTRHECPNSTYRSPLPVVFSRARGSRLWDVEGKEYIDLCGGFGAVSLGHGDRAISDLFPVSDAMVQGVGDLFASEDKVVFLETLSRILGHGLTKGIVTLTGGQAVEAALKTALLSGHGSGVIAFRGAYHGLDLGVLPLSWREDFRAPFASWISSSQVEFAPFGCQESELVTAAKNLRGRGHAIAAMIVEPIQGRAGTIVPPPGWLHSLREFCNREGVLLIFDEILTGMGRSGVISHAAEAKPDLVCLGKAIGGGMPIAACMGTNEAMAVWQECASESIHTGTFFGHPLICRVASRVIDAIAERRLCGRAEDLGGWLLENARAQLSHLNFFVAARGRGLMVALEFKDAGTGERLMLDLLKRGVLAIPSGRQGRCLSLTPALTISMDDLMQGLGEIRKSVEALYSH